MTPTDRLREIDAAADKAHEAYGNLRFAFALAIALIVFAAIGIGAAVLNGGW